jgi:hypothetical protein
MKTKDVNYDPTARKRYDSNQKPDTVPDTVNKLHGT